MSLKSDLETLASSIANKAKLSETSLQESVDALKALTQYYAILQKGRKGDDEDESGTFSDFAATIDAVEEQPANGSSVRGDRERKRKPAGH